MSTERAEMMIIMMSSIIQDLNMMSSIAGYWPRKLRHIERSCASRIKPIRSKNKAIHNCYIRIRTALNSPQYLSFQGKYFHHKSVPVSRKQFKTSTGAFHGI